MTKPANFPERKRQRQLGALARIQPFTKAKVSNVLEIEALRAATATSKRDVKTKKVRA
jgi:hypothetical protein